MLTLTALKTHFVKTNMFFIDTLLLPRTPLKTLYIGKPCLNICQCDFIVLQTKKKERKDTGKRKD